MAFDSYAAIEARTSEACDAINDGWYVNCVQTAGAFFAGYTDGGMEARQKGHEQQGPYRRVRGLNSRVY